MMFGFINKLFNKQTNENWITVECEYRFNKVNAICVNAIYKIENSQTLTDEEYEELDTVVVRFIKFVRNNKDNQIVLEWFNKPEFSDILGYPPYTRMFNIMKHNPTKFPKFNILMKNDRIKELEREIAKDFE